MKRLAAPFPAELAGHSHGAGLATRAASGGASERAIMAQTGHTKVEVVRRYSEWAAHR
jgi:integrase